MTKIEILKKLNSIVAGGKKKTQLELEIGLPKNSLSNFLSGKKELPNKWVERLSMFLESKDITSEPKLSKLGEIEDLKIENQKLRMELLEARSEIVKLTKQLAEKSKTGATIVQDLTGQGKKSNFTINTKKGNYDPFKNPLFNSKNKTKAD